jgi:predicted NUDIX family phosphoesterase
LKEQLWALPAEIANRTFKQPFTPFDEEALYDILDEQTIVANRDVLEHDEGYKQIVPYIAMRVADGRYFRYARSGGEERLVSKYSVGVGGHANLGDVIRGACSDEIVFWAATRELHEEFVFKNILGVDYLGVINSNGSPVDRVHLGIAIIVMVDGEEWICKEPDAISPDECTWRSAEELMMEYELHESWSQILISNVL